MWYLPIRSDLHGSSRRFTPKKIESRSSYLSALLSCYPCQPSDVPISKVSWKAREGYAGMPSYSSLTPHTLTAACTTSRTRAGRRDFFTVGRSRTTRPLRSGSQGSFSGIVARNRRRRPLFERAVFGPPSVAVPAANSFMGWASPCASLELFWLPN